MKEIVAAMFAEALPALDEFADCCEAITRSVRCIMLLVSANVDVERLVPHLETMQAAIARLEALKPRMDAVTRKHGG